MMRRTDSPRVTLSRRIDNSPRLSLSRRSNSYIHDSPNRARQSYSGRVSGGAADMSSGSRLLLDINAHTVDSSGRISLPNLEERCAALAISAKYVLNFYTEFRRDDGVQADSYVDSLTPEALAEIKNQWDAFLNFKKNLLITNHIHEYHFLKLDDLLKSAGIDAQDAPEGVVETIELANCAVLLHYVHQLSAVWSRSDITEPEDIIDQINLVVTKQSVRDLREIQSIFLKRLVPPTIQIDRDVVDLEFELATHLYLRRQKLNDSNDGADEQNQRELSNNYRAQFADTASLRKSLLERGLEQDVVQELVEDRIERVEDRLEKIDNMNDWDQIFSEYQLLDMADAMAKFVSAIVGQLDADMNETPVSVAVDDLQSRVSALRSPSPSYPDRRHQRSISATLRHVRGGTYPTASTPQGSFSESDAGSTAEGLEFAAERLNQGRFAALDRTNRAPMNNEESQRPPSFGPRPARAPPRRLGLPETTSDASKGAPRRAPSPVPATRMKFDQQYRLQRITDDRSNRFRDANTGVKMTVFDEDDPESQRSATELTAPEPAAKKARGKAKKRARTAQITEDEEAPLSAAESRLTAAKKARAAMPSVVVSIPSRRTTRAVTRSQSVVSEAESNAREEDAIAASLFPPVGRGDDGSAALSREPSPLGDIEYGGDAPDIDMEDFGEEVGRAASHDDAADATMRNDRPRSSLVSRPKHSPRPKDWPIFETVADPPRRSRTYSPLDDEEDLDVDITPGQQRRREKAPAVDDDGYEVFSEDSQDESQSRVERPPPQRHPDRRPGLMPTGKRKAATSSAAPPATILPGRGRPNVRKVWTQKEEACLVKAIEQGLTKGFQSHIWSHIAAVHGSIKGGKLKRFDNVAYKDKARNICMQAMRTGKPMPAWQPIFFSTLGKKPHPIRSQRQKKAFFAEKVAPSATHRDYSDTEEEEQSSSEEEESVEDDRATTRTRERRSRGSDAGTERQEETEAETDGEGQRGTEEPQASNEEVSGKGKGRARQVDETSNDETTSSASLAKKSKADDNADEVGEVNELLEEHDSQPHKRKDSQKRGVSQPRKRTSQSRSRK